jgi:hypothetical protein
MRQALDLVLHTARRSFRIRMLIEEASSSVVSSLELEEGRCCGTGDLFHTTDLGSHSKEVSEYRR